MNATSKREDASPMLFEQMENQTWSFLVQCLKKHEGTNRHGYWTNGDDILCKTEEAAENLANFLEDIGFDVMQTGHYFPEDDEREGCTDDHTGFWYVCPD